MELTVQNLYGLLLRSRLLSLGEAKAMYARWDEASGEHAHDLSAFLQWLVKEKYLTEYQATLLGRGHAEGFFLNQYKVLDRLGKGRMAGVYKAQHATGQIVAIKVLPPSRAREPGLLSRFQREARLSMRLTHPNVVRTFQLGEAEQGGKGDKLHYLVMEYLEGETLEELLQRKKQLPPAEAVAIIYQALQGLQHIHTQGLVHRDLKPSNLMLTHPVANNSLACGVVKILDLGLSRAMFDESLPAQPEEEAALTGEGVLLGTPDYMAPEQARDARSVDIRSDIYSLGCVLYHLLAGSPPFPDTNIISQMIRHATESPRSLKEYNEAIPDGLQQIVNWMMAKDPAKRYASPERAALALQIYLPLSPEELSETQPQDPQMTSFLTWLDMENPEVAQGLTPSATDNPPPGDKKTPTEPPRAARKTPAEEEAPAVASANRPPVSKPAESGKAGRRKLPEDGKASAPSPAKEGTGKQPALATPRGKEGTAPRQKALPAAEASAGAPSPAPGPQPLEPPLSAAPPPTIREEGKPAATGLDKGETRPGSKSRKPRERALPAPSGPRPAPGVIVTSGIDVELVAIPPPGEPPLLSFPLQRRDFVMFSIGVATAFLGLGLGWLVSRILGGRRTTESDEPTPKGD